MRIKNSCLWIFLTLSLIVSAYSKIGFFLFILSLFLLIWSMNKRGSNITEKGIILLLIYIPFYTYIRLYLIYLGMSSISSILNYFRDFVILLLFVITVLNHGGRIKKDNIVWLYFVITWGIGLILSAVNGYASIGISGFHFAVIPMLLFPIIVAYNGDFDIEIIISIFLKIAVLIAIIGFIFYNFRTEIFLSLFRIAGNENNPQDYVRFISIFFTPNVCGCYFSMALCVAVVKCVYDKEKLYIIHAGIFMICILLTLSRGSWMFIAASLFVLLYIIKPMVGFRVAAIGIVLLLFWDFLHIDILNSFMGNIIQDRFFSLFDSNSISSYGRVSYWKEVLEQLKMSPIGYGMGASTTAQISRNIETGVLVVDGYYVKTIVETGILGFIYCILFIIWILKKAISNLVIKRSSIQVIAIMMSIGMIVQAFGSNVFDFVCTAPLFWMFLGFSDYDANKGNTY